MIFSTAVSGFWASPTCSVSSPHHASSGCSHCSHSLSLPCHAWKKQVLQAAVKKPDYCPQSSRVSFLSRVESFLAVLSWSARSGEQLLGQCNKLSFSLQTGSSSLVFAWGCCVLPAGFWSTQKGNLVSLCLHEGAKSSSFLFLHLTHVIWWILILYISILKYILASVLCGIIYLVFFN